jgi:hypothetical protein
MMHANILYALAQPAVDVDINKGGAAWYSNPLYVGIGVIVLLLVVLIAVSAARRA